MKYINIIAEGKTEEVFVKDVLIKHFASIGKYISVRIIETGWDSRNNKPAKGGLLKYEWLKNDILKWIESDRGRTNTWYTTFVDLYAFPVDDKSPYSQTVRGMQNIYARIEALENAMGQSINHPTFIPYVQLHEFEALLLVEPDRLLTMYPEHQAAVKRLKGNIQGLNPEEINESPQTAPSKRIIQFLPEYEGQKAQVGPMVAEDIGLHLLRERCPHFDAWITKLENL